MRVYSHPTQAACRRFGLAPVLILIACCMLAQGASAKRVLRVVHWWNAKDFAPAMSEFVSRYPEYEIKQESRAWGDPYTSKLLLETAAGKSADVYFLDAQWFSSLIFKNSVLKPLSKYARADKLDLTGFCVHPAIEQGNGSEFYALPQWLPDNPSLWVNKTITANAGITLPEFNTPLYDTWKWDDLLAAAKKTTRMDANNKPQQWGMSSLSFSTWATLWAMQAGADIFDDPTCRKETKINLVNDEFADSIQWIFDAMHRNRVMPIPGQALGFSGHPFTSGKVAFTTEWNLIDTMSKAKFDWTIMPWPYQTRKVTKYGGNSWAIAGTSKNVEGAWKLVKFLTTDLAGQKLMARVGPLSSYKPEVQLAELKGDAKLRLMNQILVSRIKGVTFRPLWLGHRNPMRAQGILQKNLDAIFSAKVSVKAGLTSAEKEINSVIYQGVKK